MALARMMLFHLQRFIQVRYFLTLLVTTTLSMVVLQWLAGRAAGTGPNPELWLRAGLVGMWSVCTVSAGIIGFQRFMGTLPFLLFSPRPAVMTLLPVVASGSVVGLGAFPLAALAAILLGQGVAVDSLPRLLLGIAAFWVACVSMCVVIAAAFVLSANAITYEPLIMIPVVLASGVFGYVAPQVAWLGWAMPTSHAINYLSTGEIKDLLLALVVSALWAGMGALAAHAALRRATVHGTLEVTA